MFLLLIEEILLNLVGLQYYLKVSICLGFHAANAHLIKWKACCTILYEILFQMAETLKMGSNNEGKIIHRYILGYNGFIFDLKGGNK